MKQLRLGRVSEDTIRNALYYIRAECVRDGKPGLEHVEALLRERGHNPEAQHVPAKTDRQFRRGELRRLVLAALKDGPRTGPEIARYVSEASGVPYRAAYKRAYIALHKMQEQGVVQHEERVWLAP